MKEKLMELWKKTREIVAKLGHKTVITVAAVAVIGVAVILNLILVGGDGGSGDLKPVVDLSDPDVVGGTQESGGEGSSDADASNEDYFAQMVLSREQARDEAMEVLQGVVDSEDAIEQLKNDAMEDMRRIAEEIKLEANIESLIMSKGFEQCVAVINGERASIVVSSEGLLPGEVSQISEIVYEQAGVLPTNLNIIEKN